MAQSVPPFGNRIESASSSFERAAVLSDPKAVWFISRGAVASDLAEGRMAALDIDTSATLGAVGIMSRADEIPSAAARAFTKMLSDQMLIGDANPLVQPTAFVARYSCTCPQPFR